MWFFLLFIAGITSSVAMTQPAIAFLEDEFKWKRQKAVNAVFSVLATCSAIVIAFFRFGFLDELDFWAGTFGLVVFAAIEIVLFSWVFGLKKGWQEMHKGADLKVPRIFKFILTYVTPIYLLVLLGVWTYQDAIKEFLMKGEEPARHPYLWGARVMIVAAAPGHVPAHPQGLEKQEGRGDGRRGGQDRLIPCGGPAFRGRSTALEGGGVPFPTPATARRRPSPRLN